MAIYNTESGDYAKYFIQNSPGPGMDPEFKRVYDKFAKRILWMDSDVCPGAFQMNTAWYYDVPEKDPMFEEHWHDDCDELVGFFSSDPNDPYNLGAEIEYWIEGEAHILTKSTMIFIPLGLKHNPMRVLKVDRPVFHFSVVNKKTYEAESVYK